MTLTQVIDEKTGEKDVKWQKRSLQLLQKAKTDKAGIELLKQKNPMVETILDGMIKAIEDYLSTF
ncbi:MAG: hypothetical protein FWG44_08460 [Oscillospiraceae bacterium]|nr:hypothetical protein [Oscillospiraceae bacterium]